MRISELTNGGPGGDGDTFVELANFGDEVAELDGWAFYRCVGSGSRFRDPQVPPFDGVILAPGETYTIADPRSTVTHLADRADAISGYHNSGFGVVLEDADRQIVDAVAVFPETVQSDCSDRTPNNLPSVLDFERGQSYQRVATTGDLSADFIVARRTPAAPNATEPDPGVQPSDVLVSELTNGGPDGNLNVDNFIELANFGDEPVDISGWEVWRCRAPGIRLPTYQQVTVPDGTVLQPSEVFVAAHQSVDVSDEVPHAHYSVSLANEGFGAMVEDTEGNIMDAVGVFETDGVHQVPMDDPCTQGTALPNRLDFGFNETYQRFQNTGDNSADFLKAERTMGEMVIHDPDDFPEPEDPELGPVQISEITHGGPGGGADDFFELANLGDEPVSLEGWTIHRCEGEGVRSGLRAPEPQFPPFDDLILEPGETFLAVRQGSPMHAEGNYDAVYRWGFHADQFGLIVYDADGNVADSVGVSHANTANITYVHCTMGLPLQNTLLRYVDDGQSFQRYRSTGNNIDDFLPAPRTPGELNTELRPPHEFTDDELAPVDVEPNPRSLPAALVNPQAGAIDVGTEANLTVTAQHTTGDDVEVTFRGAQQVVIDDRATRAFTGVSDQAPPAQRRPRGARPVRGQLPLDGTGEPLVAEATEGFPYQRYQMVLDRIDGDEIEVVWSGRSTGRNELQLYAWNHSDSQWELLDTGGGVHGGEITLIGTADVASTTRGRMIEVLVQDGPGTDEAFTDADAEPNRAFKEPAEYDFAWGYVTDTQFHSQGSREVYAEMNRWLVTNQDAREIAYSFHAGDLTQSWSGGVQLENRARDELQFASDVQRILEDAAHPHGVIPGNHDNKHGGTNDLYNEYFGPDRYENFPWFGGAWAPGDNQNHYDIVEIGGATFLMLYLGYFGYIDESPDEGIEWAKQVIAEHPGHNVIVTTHDYITPDGALSTPDTESATCGNAGTAACASWNALGHRYWNEVILPNENVFMVLAGHRTGVALNIKRDVGGVAGRTVVEMMGNYQNFQRDGHRDTGFLRLLQIDVDSKTMAVNTYSPTLEEHNAWEYDHAVETRYDDGDDEFTIVDIGLNDSYDKRVETDVIGVFTPMVELGTIPASAGSEATLTWSTLSPHTGYGWYTETRDGAGGIARSPFWTLTTSQ